MEVMTIEWHSPGKGKVVLVLLSKHYAMKAYWKSGGIAHTLFTSALDGGEWSASRPCRFTPREEPLGTRADLDEVVRRKIPSPYRDSNPRSSSP
jgi:hypothetical protein